MHNQPMKTIEADDAEANAFEQRMGKRIEQALERPPHVEISADFAARVASKVPAKRRLLAHEIPLRTTRYGYAMASIAMVVLLAAMVSIAIFTRIAAHPASGPALWSVAVEWTLCVQFVLLVVWLGVRSEPS